MRLGRIKQILDNVVDDNNNIIVENEPIFGGQAYIVNNYIDLVDALNILSEQEWNDYDFAPISSLIKSHPPRRSRQQLTQEEYGQLSSYISSVNHKLPYFYSILESVVEDQDEKVINIKLPEEIDTLSKLSDANKRLEKIFKIFSIDGQFELEGFDKGTEWYVMCTTGYLSYLALIKGLEIAKNYFETREAYFKSKKAELDYKASLKNISDFNKDGMEAYCERRLELDIEVEVQEAAEQISETNGKTPQELQTHMIQGVKEIVKELAKGTEFHLSLNPPEYVEGNIGNLNIDYKKVHQIRAEEAKRLGTDKQKELPEPKKPEEGTDTNKEEGSK